MIRCQPHRHPGRAAHVPRLPVGAVRALARRQRLLLVALPPRRAAQPLPRLGRPSPASTASSNRARASSQAAFRSATRPAASGSVPLTAVEPMRRPYLPARAPRQGRANSCGFQDPRRSPSTAQRRVLPCHESERLRGGMSALARDEARSSRRGALRRPLRPGGSGRLGTDLPRSCASSNSVVSRGALETLASESGSAVTEAPLPAGAAPARPKR